MSLAREKARLIGIVSLCGLALGAPAKAETTGWRYEIMWGGFHAGDMSISRDHQHDAIVTGMTIRTQGLFDRFLRLRFNARGDAKTDAAPLAYQTRFRNRYQERLFKVSYGAEAVVERDEVLAVFAPPPEDDEPPPPIPDSFRRGAVDPLTNLLRAGRGIAAGSAPFRLVSFDGKRAYSFDVSIQGPRRVTIRGVERDVIAATMVMKPLAGFKTKFVKLWDSVEYEIDLDPATQLPMRVRSDGFAAALVINALEPCRAEAEACVPALTAGKD